MPNAFKLITVALITYIFLGCNLAIGTNFNLTIFGEDEEPIRDAQIKGGCGDGGFDGITDENGEFSLSTQCALDEGFYFTIRKDGFLDYSEAIRPLQFDQYKPV